MFYFYDRLMMMSMFERDEKWIIGVNGFLDSYRFFYMINSVFLKIVEDIKIYVWLLCWMFIFLYFNFCICMICVVCLLMLK